MTIRVAINGYGRIGRCILRSIFEYQRQNEFHIVAINDPSGDIATTAHLTRYDSTHGRFAYPVTVENNYLNISNNNTTTRILITQERDPLKLPWKENQIDLVFECTGRLLSPEEAGKHILAGAKKVLISAPGNAVEKTIVYGVNHQTINASDTIISNASCTTNCLAPIAKILHESVGIQSGLLNTVHAFTKDQMLLDGHHKDLHRARAATASIIPTKTGAAKAVGLVLPELAGKLDGFAMRVPTINVSVIDLTFISNRKTTVQEINTLIREAQNEVLHYSDEPLVSCDFNHHKASAIFDGTQTKVMDSLVKIVAWYDNEWGFSNRMLDTGSYMMNI